MVADQPYQYDNERYVAACRVLGGRTLGVSIPMSIRESLGIRPGTLLLIKVRVLKSGDQKEINDF